jgi:hypothetical protein
MSLQSKLDHLRAQPIHVRKHFAFWTSFGVTGIIALIWLGSFTSLGVSSQTAVASAVSNIRTPAQQLTASVGTFFDDIRDMIFTPKRVVYKAVIVKPGRK